MTTFAANGAIMISCSILMYFLLPYNGALDTVRSLSLKSSLCLCHCYYQ